MSKRSECCPSRDGQRRRSGSSPSTSCAICAAPLMSGSAAASRGCRWPGSQRRHRRCDPPHRHGASLDVAGDPHLGSPGQLPRRRTGRAQRRHAAPRRPTAPGPLAVHGIGYEVAAKLLMAAGDNPNTSPTKPPSPTSAAARRARHPRARPDDAGSTEAATDKPTTPSTASSSPGCAHISRPRTTSPARCSSNSDHSPPPDDAASPSVA
jgi:hypothetical protein